MDWTTKYLPFTRGLDLAKEALLNSEGFVVAENVDWDHDGAICGRPSRSAPMQFRVSNMAGSDDTSANQQPVYGAAQTFASTGFSPLGLCRVRNRSGEHVALACAGRIFSAGPSGTEWVDRGRFNSARVDRLYDYLPNQPGSTITRYGVAPDFGPGPDLSLGSSSAEALQLLNADFSPGPRVFDNPGGAFPGTNPYARPPGGRDGNGARCGTTTAMVSITSTTLTDDTLAFTYRTNGADALTTVYLATNATSPTRTATGGNGDCPCIVGAGDGSGFYVIYRTSTANQFTLLKVSTTGSILHTASETLTGLVGFWVTSTPDGRAVVTATSTDGHVYFYVFNSTMVLALNYGQVITTGSGPGLKAVVCGTQDNNTIWWAAVNWTNAATGLSDVVIGRAATGSGSAYQLLNYAGGGGSATGAILRWSIAHQPVTLNGRVYITLVAALCGFTNDVVTNGGTGTWVTIDLTDLSPSGGADNAFPDLVARGPTEATFPHGEAATATPLTDGTGWVFATIDWNRLEVAWQESTVGVTWSLGINRVTLLSPRAVEIGESVVFSGSVPHVMGRSQCYELGFPFLAGQPGIYVTSATGNAVGANGSVTFQALWRWTDDAGIVHRSTPSVAGVFTAGASATGVQVVVTAPQLIGHRGVVVEIYATGLNPTGTAPLYLQYTYTFSGPVSGTATVSVTFDGSTNHLVTNTEPLYTNGGAYANVHVPADGGVAVVGNRLWMATDRVVYASKLLDSENGPGFNDTGALQVSVPAGVGRIQALESQDNRLIILCERGILDVPDGGPDNLGQGLQFATPQRVSELGVAGPRASCVTPRGLVFVVPLNATEYQRGGPWIMERGLVGVSYLGAPVRNFLAPATGFTPEVAYCPERDTVFMTYSGAGYVATGTGVIVLDFRQDRSATWANQDTPNGAQRSICCANGVLWTLCNEPAPYDGALGSGFDNGTAYTMTLVTDHIPVADNGLAWGRVRSVTVLGTDNTTSCTLTISALLDQNTHLTSGAQTVNGQGGDLGTWPAERQAPEWRLPTQKCSTIQITLSASPAGAEWAALALRVRPIASKAPPYQRF